MTQRTNVPRPARFLMSFAALVLSALVATGPGLAQTMAVNGMVVSPHPIAAQQVSGSCKPGATPSTRRWPRPRSLASWTGWPTVAWVASADMP